MEKITAVDLADMTDSSDVLIKKPVDGPSSSEGTGSTDSVPEIDQDNRESWDNKVQYLLAVIGYAVGLGNVWRFPYLAQKNGGGAFLIPYVIMLAIEGIPLFYLELAVGQRLRKGAIGAWNEVSPYLGGIGIACAFVSFWVSLYYNTIIAWCLYYMVQSFRSPLPWAQCPTIGTGENTTLVKECELSSPTTYFWYRETLNISDDVNIGGQVNWWIVVALVVAWIIVFLCMAKGIASSGKVVYFTATFPYVVLIIFFFRGVTLDGFHHGLHHFFVPDFARLADPQVWLDAATQIFFSLGLAFGGLVAFSSYMPVRNNCYKDAVLISVINCGTSVFAGIVVFSILGFKATQTFNTCIESRNTELVRLFNTTDVVIPGVGTSANFTMYNTITEDWYQTIGEMPSIPVCDLKAEIEKSGTGTGLAFIAFTEAINQLPVAQFWSVLFFLMLLTLGLDSMFGMLEGVVTSVVDMKLVAGLTKPHVSGAICFVSFLLSLSFTNQAGQYIFVLFDEFSGNIPLLIIALFEVLGISYIYGIKRFSDDIELMTGQRPNWYWLICWKYVSPFAMSVILFASLVNMMAGTSYQAWKSETATIEMVEWPGWGKFLAAFLIITPVMWIPGVAIVKYFRLYNWQIQEKAIFPTEELRAELESSGKRQEITDWERKLFFWMPKLTFDYEIDEVTDNNSAGDTDNNSAGDTDNNSAGVNSTDDKLSSGDDNSAADNSAADNSDEPVKIKIIIEPPSDDVDV